MAMGTPAKLSDLTFSRSTPHTDCTSRSLGVSGAKVSQLIAPALIIARYKSQQIADVNLGTPSAGGVHGLGEDRQRDAREGTMASERPATDHADHAAVRRLILPALPHGCVLTLLPSQHQSTGQPSLKRYEKPCET